MTAEQPNDFDYSPASEHESEADRRKYWAIAIGLQQVDGLEVSPYLRELADAYVKGEYSLSETRELLAAYHVDVNNDSTQEADVVSQRIAELLEASPFVLSQDMLVYIHRHLFQDLDSEIYHPGEFKQERFVKQELILNGDSVLYADPSTYEMSLRYVFSQEQAKHYSNFDDEELEGFTKFISQLWQIHPFYEGNTRAVAVYSILYLNSLGYEITNDPFAQNAQYYRDALVRSMYRNAQAQIETDSTYLFNFYENIIGRERNSFNREDLICTKLFESPQLLRYINPAEAIDKRNLKE